MTGGKIQPGPSAKQERHAEQIDKICSPLSGVARIVFVSCKGGVGKTTLTAAVGGSIARERGDRVIAVDVNTDLGNLAERFSQSGGPHANIETLASLREAPRYATVREYTVQNRDRLECLASQSDPSSTYTLNAQDYTAAMSILESHYNVVLLDYGTAITAPLFTTIASEATGLVIVAAQNSDGVKGARKTLMWLQSHGFGSMLPRTVVALNATDRGKPLIYLDKAKDFLHETAPSIPFEVIPIPYDPHLAEGTAIEHSKLRTKTKKSLQELAAAMAEHYPLRHAGSHHQGI